MKTHRQIIELWPDLHDFSAAMGEPYHTVLKWRTRGRIPAKHWYNLMREASKRSYDITYEDLAKEIAQ